MGINWDNHSVQVQSEDIRRKVLRIDLTQFVLDPSEFDTVEIQLETPNARPRRITLDVGAFIEPISLRRY